MDIIDQTRYSDAWQRYENTYLLSDKALYDIFACYSGHTDYGEVVAKVLLVDAVYLTNLVSKQATVVAIVNCLCSPSVHNIFDDLMNCKSVEAINLDPAETLGKVIKLHGQLVDHIHQHTRIKATVFASKYMHFHRRDIVPILDSWSEKAIKELNCKGHHIACSRTPYNERYYRFCEQFLCLWRDALTFDSSYALVVKKIDQYLYQYLRSPDWIAENYFSQEKLNKKNGKAA